MKVLHVDTGTNWRGGQAQVFGLNRGLENHEVDNHLLTPPGSALAERLRNQHVDTTINHHALRGEWDVSAAWKIRSLHRRESYDLIHAHDSHGLGICWASSLFTKLPPAIATRRLELPVAQNFFSRRKYRFVDQFIAISEPVKDSLIESGMDPEDISVIPSGVNLEKIEQARPDYKRIKNFGLDPDRPIIGNIGALTKQKDQATFIRAAAGVLESHPEAQFLIAGSGELREDLESLIHELDLKQQVVLAGFQEQIYDLMKTFDLFVLTSIFEGLCSTLLQIMGAEVPIIASDVGGVGDLIVEGETGVLVESKDTSGFTSAITSYLENPNDFTTYIQNAQQKVQKYDFSSIADKTADLYRSVQHSN